MMRKLSGSIVLAMCLAAFEGAGGHAQVNQGQVVPPVEQILAAFEREHEQPTNYRENPDASWVSGILNESARFGLEHMVDPLIEGLERLAMSARSPNVRLQAVMHLAGVGEPAPPTGTGMGRMDIANRLRRIYEANRGTSLIESAVIRRVGGQANVQEAAEILRSIVLEDRPEYHASDTPPAYMAVFELTRLDDPGRNVLRQLHSGGQVKDPTARSYLNWLSQRGFRGGGRG